MGPWTRAVLATSIAGLVLTGCKPNRAAETVPCDPGTEIWIGCNQACSLGQCTGNPALRICDGDTSIAACTDDTAIAVNDDSNDMCFSTCPLVQMLCPASGHVTVLVRRGRGDSSCDWGVAERPIRLDASVDASAGESDAAIEDASIDAAIEDASTDAAIDDAGAIDATTRGRDR